MKSLRKIFGVIALAGPDPGGLRTAAYRCTAHRGPASHCAIRRRSCTAHHTATQREKTKLLIWYWGEQEAPGMKSFMEKAVQIYNQENPNMTVEAVLQESDSLYPGVPRRGSGQRGPRHPVFLGRYAGASGCLDGQPGPGQRLLEPGGAEPHPGWTARGDILGRQAMGSSVSIRSAPSGPITRKCSPRRAWTRQIPPATWDEWMAACDKLNAAGITPIGTGFKDGWLGGWMVSYLGQQNLNSIDDLMAAIRGEKSLTEPMYAEWWSRWKEMQDHKCFNDDIMSLDLYQGQDLFEQQKVAMTNHVEPYIAILERKLGADTVGVMRTPAYGTGKLANSVGIPAQVLAITSFSPHKQEAADFLKFLHREDIMKMMYDMAGAITPDDRFKTRMAERQLRQA